MSAADGGNAIRVELQTLGQLDLVGLDETQAAGLHSQPKRLALVVYLALAPAPYFRRRDTIVALFWPELDAAHARGALRQALRFIRLALGADMFITRGPDEIGAVRTRLHCDVHAFEQAIASNDLSGALDCYRGDLLDGVHISGVSQEFESWIEGERRRLRAMARDCARALTETSRTDNDALGTVRWAQRAYELSSRDERDLLPLLSALAATGDRIGALRLFDQHARELAEYANASPTTETNALVQQIRDGAIVRIVPAAAVAREHVDDEVRLVRRSTSPTNSPAITPRSRRPMMVTALAVVSLFVIAGIMRWRARSPAASGISAGAIATRVASGSRSSRQTTSSAAAAADARGQFLLGKRDRESIRKARDQFLIALDLDPADVEAWVGLSYSYNTFAHYGMLASTEAVARGDAAARKAIALDPNAAMAHVLLASTVAFQQWRWGEGERQLRDAIAMDTTLADAFNLLGVMLRVEGRFDEALAAERRAARIDPLARHYQFQEGRILLCAHRYADALRFAQAALSLGTRFERGHDLAEEALRGLGRYREALEERMLSLGADSSGFPPRSLTEPSARRRLDSMRLKEAVDELVRIERIPLDEFVPPSHRADAYAAVGDWPQAFHWLNEALRARDMVLIQITCNSDYAPVRGDPRFIAVLQQLGLSPTPRELP